MWSPRNDLVAINIENLRSARILVDDAPHPRLFIEFEDVAHPCAWACVVLGADIHIAVWQQGRACGEVVLMYFHALPAWSAIPLATMRPCYEPHQ